jgi:hypothetical protein
LFSWKCFKCKKRCKCDKCKDLYKQISQSSLNKNDTKEETQSNITFYSNINNNVKKNQKNKKVGKIKIFLNKSKKKNKHNVFNNYNIIEVYEDENNQSINDNKKNIKYQNPNYSLNNNNNLTQIENIEKDSISIEELKELIEKNKNKYLRTYEKCLKHSNNLSNIECDLCGLESDSIENIANFLNGKYFLEFFFHFFVNYDYLITTKTQNQILIDAYDIFQLIINYNNQKYDIRNICKCCLLKIANSKFNFNKIYMSMFSQNLKKENYGLNLKNNSNNYQIDKIENNINKSNILKIPLYDMPNYFNNEFLFRLKNNTHELLININKLIQFIKGYNKYFDKNDCFNFFIIQNQCINTDFQNLLYEYEKINDYIENLKKYAEEYNEFKKFIKVFEVALKNNNQCIKRLKEYYKDYEDYYKQFCKNLNLFTYFCPTKK